MSRNKRFKIKYVIIADGVTTNGFAEKMVDEALSAMTTALNNQYKQVGITMIKEFI